MEQIGGKSVKRTYQKKKFRILFIQFIVMAYKSKFPKFLEKMKEVLNDPRSVILTDRELLVAVNQKLKPAERVSVQAFDFWKAPTLNPKSPENTASIPKEMTEEFRQVLDYARVEQKMNLTGNMLDEKNKNQWGSSWILEKKFRDLKNNPQLQLTNVSPMINIQAGDSETKKLMESIINGDTIDIPHEEVDDNHQGV